MQRSSDWSRGLRSVVGAFARAHDDLDGRRSQTETAAGVTVYGNLSHGVIPSAAFWSKNHDHEVAPYWSQKSLSFRWSDAAG